MVLLERIQVAQQKSVTTSDGIKKRKRVIEKSTSEKNQNENEQWSKRKRCSHCAEIAVLKKDNEQLLRQANELQVQLNYLSTAVEEVVEQQLQLVKKTSNFHSIFIITYLLFWIFVRQIRMKKLRNK